MDFLRSQGAGNDRQSVSKDTEYQGSIPGQHIAVADLRGAPRRAPPPTAQNVLNSMQFFVKFTKICRLAPPPTGNPGSATALGSRNVPHTTVALECNTFVLTVLYLIYWSHLFNCLSKHQGLG